MTRSRPIVISRFANDELWIVNWENTDEDRWWGLQCTGKTGAGKRCRMDADRVASEAGQQYLGRRVGEEIQYVLVTDRRGWTAEQKRTLLDQRCSEYHQSLDAQAFDGSQWEPFDPERHAYAFKSFPLPGESLVDLPWAIE